VSAWWQRLWFFVRTKICRLIEAYLALAGEWQVHVLSLRFAFLILLSIRRVMLWSFLNSRTVYLIFYLWFRRLINYIDRSSLAGVNDVTWSRPQYITLSQLRYKRARVSVDFCPLGVVISRFRKSLDDRLRMRRICDDPIVGTWRTIVYQRRPIAVDSKNHDCCLCRIARFRKRT